jgi:hypothetical protein
MREDAWQLSAFLTGSDILPGFHNLAGVDVSLSPLAAVDADDLTVLALLDDLFAAFDCFDHQFLVQRQRQTFSIYDSALDCT